MPMNSSIVRVLIWAFVVLTGLAVVGTTWIHPESTQWDFRVYYYASQVQAQGENPYDLTFLSRAAGADLHHGYVYPPVILWAFRPFTLLPYTAAFRTWLLLKLVLLVFLIRLWARTFANHASPLVLVLVSLLAFDGSLLCDIRAGNVSVLEQLLLWSGFAALLRGRPWLFTLLVAVAATFKMALAGFLVLLVFPPERRWGHLLAGLGGVAALVVLPCVFHPELASGFLGSLDALHGFGHQNQSSLGLIDQILGHLAVTSGWLAYPLWALFAVVVVGLTLPALRTTPTPVRIALVTILYAMLAPRMITYSYLILIPAVFLVWLPLARRWDPRILLGILICAYGLKWVPPLELGEVWRAVSPYPVVLLLWLATVIAIRRDPGGGFETKTAV